MAARQTLLEPAIIVIGNDPDFASAEAWFYGLDKVFKTQIPYKAVRYPYRLQTRHRVFVVQTCHRKQKHDFKKQKSDG